MKSTSKRKSKGEVGVAQHPILLFSLFFQFFSLFLSFCPLYQNPKQPQHSTLSLLFASQHSLFFLCGCLSHFSAFRSSSFQIKVHLISHNYYVLLCLYIYYIEKFYGCFSLLTWLFWFVLYDREY